MSNNSTLTTTTSKKEVFHGMNLDVPVSTKLEQDPNGGILLNVSGDTLLLSEGPDLIYNGTVRDVVRIVCINKHTNAQGHRKMEIVNILTKEETLSAATQYIGSIGNGAKMDIWDKLMSKITVNVEEGELNPLRNKLLRNCFTYSIIDVGTKDIRTIPTATDIIVGVMTASWNDITPKYRNIMEPILDENGMPVGQRIIDTIREDGAMHLFPIYNGPSIVGKGIGTKLDFMVDIFPFTSFANEERTAVDTIDFKDIRKFIARGSSFTNNNPADIPEMDMFTLIIPGLSPGGDMFVTPQFADKIQPKRIIRKPFRDVIGWNVHVGKDIIPIDKIKLEELDGHAYAPGEVILSNGNGPVYTNNTQYDATVVRFKLNRRYFKNQFSLDLRTSLMQQMPSRGCMKYRPLLRTEDYNNQDITKAAALLGKAISSVLAKDINATINGDNYVVDSIMNSQCIKLIGCMKNIMIRTSEKYGFAAGPCKMTIDGIEYDAIAGYLPVGFEGMLWDKRFNGHKPVTMKLPYILDFTKFMHGIGKLDGMTEAGENTMVDWFLDNIAKAGKQFNKTLNLFNGKRFPGTVITIDEFAKLTNEQLLDTDRKAFTIVSSDTVKLAKKLVFPSGDICYRLYSRPVNGKSTDDYMENVLQDSGDRVFKHDMQVYVDQLRAIAKGLSISGDSILDSMQKLSDVALQQPHKAFSGSFPGGRWTLVVRDEVKHGQIHLSDDYYQWCIENGITHMLILRTPVLYPTLEIVEIRPHSELQNGSFTIDPNRNEAIAYCSPNVSNSMNGDCDGDGIFGIFFPTDLNHIARILVKNKIGKLLADNYLRTRQDPNSIGWTAAKDSDSADYTAMVRAFVDGEQVIKQYTIDEIIEAILASAQNKKSMGPTTANFWRDIILYSSITKNCEEAYGYIGNKFYRGMIGHLYLGRLVSQAVLDGIKANVDINVNSFKGLMMEVLDNPKNSGRYIKFAQNLGMSQDAIDSDLSILRATAEILAKVFPNKKNKCNSFMSGRGNNEKQILDKIITLVIGKSDHALTPSETKQLVGDIRTGLNGDYKFLKELCAPMYNLLLAFVNDFKEVAPIEVTAASIAKYTAGKELSKYNITPAMIADKGITRRALGIVASNITNAEDLNDKAVEFINALFENRENNKLTAFEKALVSVMYINGDPKLGPNEAFGNIATTCQAIMTDPTIEADKRRTVSSLFVRKAIGELLIAESAYFGNNASNSFHYRTGHSILVRLNEFATLRSRAKAWVDSKTNA